VKKKHFPRNMKISMRAPKINRSPRRILRLSGSNSTCRNLRYEFDRLVDENGILLTDEERRQLWQRVSARLLDDPDSSIETTFLIHTIGS
jgi:hypothetical protein